MFGEGAIGFKYKALLPPLRVSEAKLHLKDLVNGVVKALNELHSCGIAHIDVRLENICFDEESCHLFY